MSGAVWYCYAVARPFPTERLGEFRGVADADVLAVRHGELVAVVSQVPSDEFGESSLPARFEDLSWLNTVARTHNAVVERVAQHAVTLPFRLATIYFDRRAVASVLTERAEELSAALDRVEGRVELGVKVYTAAQAPPPVRSPPSPSPPSPSPPDRTPPDRTPEAATEKAGAAGESDTRPGMSYLRRKKSERDAKDAGWRRATARGLEIDRELTAVSAARRQHRPQSAELSEAAGENVLNVAYLVADDTVPWFVEHVRELQDATPECRIEVTGPWVPYSFAVHETPGSDSTGSTEE
jgi:gas vesicle protein GvpL/GvpF